MSHESSISEDRTAIQAAKEWREEYRDSRYLHDIPIEGVLLRREQILRNAYAFVEYRRTANDALEDPESLVWRPLIEVSEELRLRGDVPPIPRETLRFLRTAGAPPDFLKAAKRAI